MSGRNRTRFELVSGARTRKSLRAVLLLFAPVSLILITPFVHEARADGGSKSNPDLQVGGYTVFGTNVMGATVVTSGWGNVYIDGSVEIHSNLHVGGRIVSTNDVHMIRQSLAQHDQWLEWGATIQPVASYLRVRGEAIPVTLGNPQIAAGYSGQLLTLQGTDSVLKVTLVNGTGLRTNMERPFSLGAFDTVQFIYDESAGVWVEINRSQNRWGN